MLPSWVYSAETGVVAGNGDVGLADLRLDEMTLKEHEHTPKNTLKHGAMCCYLALLLGGNKSQNPLFTGVAGLLVQSSNLLR
jgi:hypothetical protein